MYEGVYKRGVAVGQTDIRTDTMTFRFKDELFEFPLPSVFHLAKYNGYWYEADVKKLRSLRKRMAHRKGIKNGIRRAI